MIVGITGKMQSGKDTTCKYIQQIYPDATRIGFADKLKQSAAACLGISVEHLEEYKLHEDMKYHPIYFNRIGDEEFDNLHSKIGPFNIRTFLQRFGTEGHRQVFGENFWIDAALPQNDHGKLYVVTDVRFTNEASAITNRDGIILEIRRPRALDGEIHDHASEQPVDSHLIDYVIDNDSDLDDLFHAVETEVWPFIQKKWNIREVLKYADSV